MDLSKVEFNLKQGMYSTISAFTDDLAKIWRNSFLYNKQGSLIYAITEEISKFSNRLIHESFNSSLSPLHVPSHSPHIKPLPLTAEQKNFIYKHAASLSQPNLNRLCGIIKNNCSISNESIEFNIDTLPLSKAKQVYSFIYANVDSQKTTIIDVPLTTHEKKSLGLNIRSLKTEDLNGIWSIVQEIPHNNEVIEFDIDTLPIRKARELQAYVKSKTPQQQPS